MMILIAMVLLVSLGLWAFVRVAPHWGLVDQPSSRSLHTTPTVVSGGIAPMLVLAVGLYTTMDFPGTQAVALMTLVLTAIGLLDDRHGLPSGVRFLCYLATGLLLCWLLLPAGSASITLLVMTTLLSHDAASGQLGRALRDTVLSMLRNPLLLAVLTGLGFSASGFQLPNLPEQFLKMLAGAAAPTALFALGITLVGQPVRAALSELTAISLLKLIVHPALMAAVFLLWPADQPIDPLWIQLAVLFASLPIAANVFALSQFYNVYTGRTATAIMLTTICASVTVPVILFLLVTWL